MIQISNQLDFARFIGNMTSPARATLTAKTRVRMNKRDVATKTIGNPYYDRIWKIQTSVVELNGDYEDKVNNQRLLESKPQDFEAGELPWGEGINNLIILKGANIYLKTHLVERVPNTTRYVTDDNVEVALNLILPFMPPVAKAKKQNLDEEVKVRSYMLDNIISLVIGKNFMYTQKEI